MVGYAVEEEDFAVQLTACSDTVGAVAGQLVSQRSGCAEPGHQGRDGAELENVVWNSGNHCCGCAAVPECVDNLRRTFFPLWMGYWILLVM